MRVFFIITLFFMTLSTPTLAGDSGTALQYLVREPKIASEHAPLLILLHGVGSNEKDLFSFANRLPDTYRIISVRAPITLGTGSYAWYHVDFSGGKPVFNKAEEQQSREQLVQFITAVKKQYKAGDVYLCGFSQGAIMSYSVGLTRPGLVQGIAVMSGRLLEEVKPLIASSEKLQTLKVFIAHGLNDAMLSIDYARSSYQYLVTNVHLKPTYKEYNEGHGINAEMLEDLIHWLP